MGLEEPRGRSGGQVEDLCAQVQSLNSQLQVTGAMEVAASVS